MGELITVDFPLPYPTGAVMPVLDPALIYECILVYIYIGYSGQQWLFLIIDLYEIEVITDFLMLIFIVRNNVLQAVESISNSEKHFV